MRAGAGATGAGAGRRSPASDSEDAGRRRGRRPGLAFAFALVLVAFFLVQLVALWYFAAGFFLTRYEVSGGRQTCQLPATLDLIRAAEERIARHQDGDTAGEPTHRALSPASCWYPRQYDRVIILLVDALRFDFAFFNSSLGSADERSPYANELPVLSTLLHSDADGEHTALFRFVADPPTVTMQRIKGLTTGGLPTFIDIKNNFGGAAITEDNWIAQLTQAQRARTTVAGQSKAAAAPGGDAATANIVHFFGDDTWFDLFPPSIHFSNASKAYPSFNVKDLHTVDDGCLSHLDPLLSRELVRLDAEASGSSSARPADAEWDVVLAHFLGVDHVGHRFGPNHPEMASKLSHMNRVIERNVAFVRRQREVNELLRQKSAEDAEPPAAQPEEVLLVVMGDHGMTADGNHGGQTPEEIYSGLFLYSTKHISSGGGASSTSAHSEGRLLEEIRGRVVADAPVVASSSLSPLSPEFTSFLSIPQVDFVPTISLLLGLPIPFGNIGKIIPELFWGRDLPESDRRTSTPATVGAAHPRDGRLVVLHRRLRSFLPLLQAIRANALQVFQYFHTYSTVVSPGTFGPSVLAGLSVDFHSGESLWQRDLARLTQSNVGDLTDVEEARRLEQSATLASKAYYAYLHSSAEVAKSRWTTFNYAHVYEGLALSALAVGAFALFLSEQRGAHTGAPEAVDARRLIADLMSALKLAVGIATPLLVVSLLPTPISGALREHTAWVAATAVSLGAIVTMVARRRRRRPRASVPAGSSSGFGLSFPTYVGLIVGVLYVQGQFSNVFIEHESSHSWYSCLLLASSWLSVDAPPTAARSSVWSRVAWLALLVGATRSMSFAATSTAPDASYQDANKYTDGDVGVMAAALWTLPILNGLTAWRLMAPPAATQSTASRQFRRAVGYIHGCIVPTAILLIFTFWSLPSPLVATSSAVPLRAVGVLSWSWQCLSSSLDGGLTALGWSSHRAWVIRVLLPRVVYALAAFGLALLFGASRRTRPETEHTPEEEDEDDPPATTAFAAPLDADESVHLALRRRREWPSVHSRSLRASPMQPTAGHDIDAAAAANLLVLRSHALLTLVCLPLLLVLGPKSSVVLVGVWCVVLSFLRLTSGAPPSLSFSESLFLAFLSLHLFYATGHANSFSSLQVAAAFIGFDTFHFAVAGALVGLNTFAHVAIAWTAAMLIHAIRHQQHRQDEKHRRTDGDGGTTDRAQSDDQVGREAAGGVAGASSPSRSAPSASSSSSSSCSFSSASLWLVFLVSCRTLVSTLNVYVQRRHLMVWAIFAPKFMFDAVFNVAVGIAAIMAAVATTPDGGTTADRGS